MELADKAFLITGGKRIGRVVAEALAARGADLALSYRGSEAEARLTVEDIRRRGRRAIAIAADLAQPDACAALVAQAAAAFDRLDGVVNMASIYQARPFDSLTTADWDLDLDVNLRAAFLCAHAAVPHLRRAGGGRIVNVADWLPASGRPHYHGFVPYYVAKAGVIALTEALALELAADGILVNAIAPGPIVPPPDLAVAEAGEVAAVTPLGRWGGEMEIARAVLALCESDFITGETIRVDGGRHLR